MNEANLQRLIDHIAANKSKFSQGDPEKCIVGTAAQLSGEGLNSTTGRKLAAGRFLGVDQSEIEIFYNAEKWPEPFTTRFYAAAHRDEVNVALDYLRSLLTGSEDTTHALGGGLSLLETEGGQHSLTSKHGKASVSIPLNLAQIRKLHLLLGAIVYENS